MKFRYWIKLGCYTQAQLNEHGDDGWELVTKEKVGKELDGSRIYEYTFRKRIDG